MKEIAKPCPHFNPNDAEKSAQQAAVLVLVY
jgi:hypothetical protein